MTGFVVANHDVWAGRSASRSGWTARCSSRRMRTRPSGACRILGRRRRRSFRRPWTWANQQGFPQVRKQLAKLVQLSCVVQDRRLPGRPRCRHNRCSPHSFMAQKGVLVPSDTSSGGRFLPTSPGSASTRTPKFRVDPTIQVLIGHGLAGAIVGWGVLIGLVATDAVGLGSLLAQADLGPLALVVLTLQFGVGFATFAIVRFGIPLGNGQAGPVSSKRGSKKVQGGG